MSYKKSITVEFHCHTTASHDGHITFDNMLETCTRKGIDVVAITDHDTVEGAREFQRRAEALGNKVSVIVGEELTLSNGGHVIGLFLQERLQSKNLRDAIGEIHEQRGICVLPHPCRSRDGVYSLVGYDETSLHFVDAFEIFNPKCSWNENRLSIGLLAHSITPIGGSDAHYEANLGECLNIVPFERDVETSVRFAIKKMSRYSVLGIPQRVGGPGRKYASSYYRIKHLIQVPKGLLPTAHMLYRLYLNALDKCSSVELEEKYRHE